MQEDLSSFGYPKKFTLYCCYCDIIVGAQVARLPLCAHIMAGLFIKKALFVLENSVRQEQRDDG